MASGICHPNHYTEVTMLTVKEYFLDEDHNFAPPEQAVYLVRQTLDDKGKLIKEEWFDWSARRNEKTAKPEPAKTL